MKILVTGAKGFVGRNLCSQLKNIRDGKARWYGGLGGVRVAVHGQQGVEHALALVGGGGAQVGGLAQAGIICSLAEQAGVKGGIEFHDVFAFWIHKSFLVAHESHESTRIFVPTSAIELAHIAECSRKYSIIFNE